MPRRSAPRNDRLFIRCSVFFPPCSYRYSGDPFPQCAHWGLPLRGAALRGKGFGLVWRFFMQCETQGFLSLSRLMPTAPSSEGAKGYARYFSPPPLGAPARGVGTALAVTEGSPVFINCHLGKEKSEYRLHCHSEERSDVGIRFSFVAAVCFICGVKEDGLPQPVCELASQ